MHVYECAVYICMHIYVSFKVSDFKRNVARHQLLTLMETKTKNSCMKSNQQRLSKPHINNGFDLICNKIFSQSSCCPDYLHWVWNSKCCREVMQVLYVSLRDSSLYSHSAAEEWGMWVLEQRKGENASGAEGSPCILVFPKSERYSLYPT